MSEELIWGERERESEGLTWGRESVSEELIWKRERVRN